MRDFVVSALRESRTKDTSYLIVAPNLSSREAGVYLRCDKIVFQVIIFTSE